MSFLDNYMPCVIRHYYKSGISEQETLRRIRAVEGQNAVDDFTVYKYYKMFKDEGVSIGPPPLKRRATIGENPEKPGRKKKNVAGTRGTVGDNKAKMFVQPNSGHNVPLSFHSSEVFAETTPDAQNNSLIPGGEVHAPEFGEHADRFKYEVSNAPHLQYPSRDEGPDFWTQNELSVRQLIESWINPPA